MADGGQSSNSAADVRVGTWLSEQQGVSYRTSPIPMIDISDTPPRDVIDLTQDTPRPLPLDLTPIINAGTTAQSRRRKTRSSRPRLAETQLEILTKEKSFLTDQIKRQCRALQIKDEIIRGLAVENQVLRLSSFEEQHASQYTRGILLGDLREICEVRDEEIEELRAVVDRHASPPSYETINTTGPNPKHTDAGLATATAVLSSATSSLRHTIACTSSQTNHLTTTIANALLNSLRSIARGMNSNTWSSSSSSLVLTTIFDLVERTANFLLLTEDNTTTQPPTTLRARFAHSFSLASSRASSTAENCSLRKAFLKADTLALQTLALYFSHGGRRASFLQTRRVVGVWCPVVHHHEVREDTRDEIMELCVWKRRFEGVREDVERWKEEIGGVVFVGASEWLDEMILARV